MAIKRRSFIQSALAVSTAAAMPKFAYATSSVIKKTKRVIVIGGGFAGATAAKYLKMWSPDTEVILIERNAQFVSCPQSNLILSGHRTLLDLTHDYHGLKSKYDIKLIQAEVVGINGERKTVKLHDDTVLKYDRVIIAPGIDFIYDNLPDLASREAQNIMPHAWKAGPQTVNLFQQIKEMRKGGRVVVTVPATPFRCPPGPYERACQIALYLKQHNPTAKLIVLDANSDIVSKKALFKSSWQQYYAGLIEYLPSNAIESIDIHQRKIETEFDDYSADVINVIPPQKAGKIADIAGVINIDNRWCEVDFQTYESTVQPAIHVIGDAIYSNLPKSAHMANAQAKVCASAITALLQEQQPEQQPVFSNTCYSFINADNAGHVAAVYRYNEEQKAMSSMPGGGVSEYASKLEGVYAQAWADNIWADTLN